MVQSIQTGRSDSDQTAPDQGLHCLLFHLHLLDALFCGLPRYSSFRIITVFFSSVRFSELLLEIEITTQEVVIDKE